MFDLFHSALKQNILCRIGSDTFCGLCRLFWLVQMICSAISCILQFSRDTISGISRSLNMQSRTGCWGWNSETGCHASITVYSQNVWLQNPFDEIDEVHHPSNGPQVRLWDPWQTSQKLSVDVLLTCQFSEFLNYMQKKKKKKLFSHVAKIFDDATLLQHQWGFEHIKVHPIKVVDNGQVCLLNDVLVITSRQHEQKWNVMCPMWLHKLFYGKVQSIHLDIDTRFDRQRIL